MTGYEYFIESKASEIEGKRREGVVSRLSKVICLFEGMESDDERRSAVAWLSQKYRGMP